MPGDNVKLERRVDHADRHGRQRAVRHPRRRPDGRLGRGDQGPRSNDDECRMTNDGRRSIEMTNRSQVIGHSSSALRHSSFHRGVAQLVEHWSPKPAVGSSIPRRPCHYECMLSEMEVRASGGAACHLQRKLNVTRAGAVHGKERIAEGSSRSASTSEARAGLPGRSRSPPWRRACGWALWRLSVDAMAGKRARAISSHCRGVSSAGARPVGGVSGW